MNKTKKHNGFTLVEMLIVLGLIALLIALVVPNTIGFLRRGEQRAYSAEQKLLQTVVDAYYADEANKAAGVRKYPTADGSGSDSAAAGSYISMPKLTSGNLIPSAPASASSSNIAGGTGSYTWYVDASGRVNSTPTYAAGT